MIGGVAHQTVTRSCNGSTYNSYEAWVYGDAKGTAHNFPGAVVTNTACGGVTSQTVTATDGSGLTLFETTNGTPTVYQSDGTKITGNGFGGSITDTNANTITFTGDTKTLKVTDTLGDSTALSGSSTVNSIGLVNSQLYTYEGPSNVQESVTVNFTAYTIQTNFGCSIGDFSGSNRPLPTSIVYQDGRAYTITYESAVAGTVTGRIASVTLPTGGTISYTYGGVDCTSVASAGSGVLGLTRTTSGGVTTYTRNKILNNGVLTGWQTTITSPLTDVTIINFTPRPYVERERLSYQGTSTLLATTFTCYNNTPNPCNSSTTTTPVSLPFSQITKVYQYPSGKQRATTTLLESHALPTETDVYDFGASIPTSKTLISYASIGNNISNRPSQVLVEDGNSTPNVFSKTTYTGYDANGNVGSINKYSSSGSFLTTSFTYNPNGALASIKDPNTSPIAFGYQSCGTQTNAFVNSVTMALGLSTSSTWDCTGAVKTSDKDVNGKITSYGYGSDPIWRIVQVTPPLGASTNITFPSFARTEAKMTFNSGASVGDTVTDVDGYGRTIRLQEQTGPSTGTYNTVSTTYDADGRVSSVSQPCAVTLGADCPISSTTHLATPGTAYSYDALNRITKTTDGGGGYTQNSYTDNNALAVLGPAVASPNTENLKQKQLEYDGLGRLSSVCEITTISGSGRCAQANSKTGYWTTYTYDAAGRLLSSNQNKQSSPVQTRTFTYDWLGRILSANHPESTVASTFVYDTDSTCALTSQGDLVAAVDSVGNRSCYSYDALHRNTSITYSGSYAANTPTKTFLYDGATVGGFTMSNAKGRLAEAYTGSKITDLGFSYDANGRTVDYFESAPHSGGYYSVVVSYWDNDVLNTLVGVGLPTITYSLDGMGRINSVKASSGTNPTSAVNYNAANQVTGVTYGSKDPVTFSYDNNTGRMKEYKLTINGTATYGDLTWNPNGSLQKLFIIDPFNPLDVQTCQYSADDLARISSVNCLNGTTNVWNQNFTYDAFGNVTKTVPTGGAGINWNPGYDHATNRYTLAGTSYDANGNLLNDSFHSYAWSVDGKPTTLDSLTLIYDALGREVEMQNGTAYTEFVFGPTGKLAIMNGQTQMKAFIPFPGGTQVKYAGSSISTYRLPDWLGSFRVGSSNSRTYSWGIAFAPFGEPYAISGSPAKSFTGEQGTADTVSDEYDFLARKQHPSQGRWISPDPMAGSRADPQSFNKYAYVRNSPLTMTDPLGLCGRGDEGNPAGCWFQDHSADFGSSTDSIDRAAGKFDIGVPLFLSSVRPNTFLGYDCSFPCLSLRLPSQIMSATVQTGGAQTIAQLEEPEFDKEEARPEAEAERALEPIEPERPEPNVFDWMHPGPLTNEIARTFSGGRYVRVEVGPEGWSMEDAHVWGPRGGPEGAQGTFYSPTPQVGGIQSMIDLGLRPEWKNFAQHMVSVYLKPGTIVYVGNVASQTGATSDPFFRPGPWVGGTIQIYVPK